MSKTITLGLAALAACALFACADGGEPVDSQTGTNETEPTPFSDENGRAAPETPRTADEREQLASANGATATAISFNHPEPHTLTISALELASARGGNFYLSEGGGALGEVHTHLVTLTADQLTQVRDGAQLNVETGVGGSKGAHTHTVTITRR